MLEAAALSTLFPVRIELIFKRNSTCNLGFSWWRYALFAPNRLIRLVEETHVSLKEIHLCQKQEHLAHCTPLKIGRVFERNTSIRVFKVEIACLFSNLAYSAALKKHMYLSKENHLC
jgi:hypothetical protein